MSISQLDGNIVKAEYEGTSFDGFVKDYQGYIESGSNLLFMNLPYFIESFKDEIDQFCEFDNACRNIAYDIHFYSEKYVIYVLVDVSVRKKHTMNSSMRKKYRKCGKERRSRLDAKYSYVNNPFNRIHGYVIVEHSPGLSDSHTLAINAFCSSNFSDIKGIGSYMMKTLIAAAKETGYLDIVLEVGSDQMEERDSSDDEESDEECDEECDEESDDEYINRILGDNISEQLWKKSVRHNQGVPYYSFSKDYIRNIIEDYLNGELEETEQYIPEIVDDEEYGYNGYYYHKSKRHSKKLMRYYEHFGFKEDAEVHHKLKCFSILPFPAMRLPLNEQHPHTLSFGERVMDLQSPWLDN